MVLELLTAKKCFTIKWVGLVMSADANGMIFWAILGRSACTNALSIYL
jgi:hypothetical protein